jgi:hypothetical protein
MKKYYKAQALAIIMVILIISSMIGFAVFSRSQKSKSMAIQERNSAEAYQVSDMILDNLLLSTLEQWLEKGMLGKTYVETYYQAGQGINPPEEEYGQLVFQTNAQMGIEAGYESGDRDITELTAQLGHPLNLQNLDICPLIEGLDNKYTLSLTQIAPGDVITIKPGQTFSFLKEDRNFSNCRLGIFVHNPSNEAGLVVNKIYEEGGSIREYNYEDTISYRFGLNPNFTHNWTLFPNDGLPIDLDNDILVIGLTAINQEVNFTFTITPIPPLGPGGCTANFNVYKLQASATCGGIYRAKEVIIPAERYTHSIFNYVFFNGNGNIGTGVQ